MSRNSSRLVRLPRMSPRCCSSWFLAQTDRFRLLAHRRFSSARLRANTGRSSIHNDHIGSLFFLKMAVLLAWQLAAKSLVVCACDSAGMYLLLRRWRPCGYSALASTVMVTRWLCRFSTLVQPWTMFLCRCNWSMRITTYRVVACCRLWYRSVCRSSERLLGDPVYSKLQVTLISNAY